MKLLGIKAYAEHRGVSLKAVQEAITYERISYYLKGKRRMINPEEADRQWEQNTDHTQNKSNPAEPTVLRGPTFQQSRAIREAYQAKLAKLEFEEKSAKLVDSELIKRESFEMSRRTRDAMLNIPSRISAQLGAMTDTFEIENFLTEEIRKALKGLISELV